VTRLRSIAGIIALAAAAAAVGAGPMRAQGNAQCAAYGSGLFGSGQAERVCNAAVDGASLFTPVAGVLITGGNPFLGATNGLGGFGHLDVTIRANATTVVIPDFSYNGEGTTVGSQQKLFAPAPLVEGALGIFPGIHRGQFAVDLLGSAQLLPTTLIHDVHIDVNANKIGTIALGFGIGGRVTLIPARRGAPGLSVSVMHRGLPRIGVGDILSGDQFSYITALNTTEYRATAAARLGAVRLGVGGGWNHYSTDAEIIFVDPVTDAEQPPINLAIRDTRALGYIDAGVGAGIFYLIGEVGAQRGKDLGLVTTFADNDPTETRLFASIGLRFGF
jgi:hypothetical protein